MEKKEKQNNNWDILDIYYISDIGLFIYNLILEKKFEYFQRFLLYFHPLT